MSPPSAARQASLPPCERPQGLTTPLRDLPAGPQADSTYRMVLKRYPRSVLVLRAYASFLEEVKHNPWVARKFKEDADRIEGEFLILQ